MIDLIPTIKALRLELQRAEQANGNDLDNLYAQLKTIIDFANQFERLWVGGWARVEYNHYQNPNKQSQNIQVNEEYFYGLIEQRLNLKSNKSVRR